MPSARQFPNVNRPITVGGRPLTHWVMAGAAAALALLFLEVMWQKILAAALSAYIVLSVAWRLEKALPGSSWQNLIKSVNDPTIARPLREENYPPPFIDTSLVKTPRGKRGRRVSRTQENVRRQ